MRETFKDVPISGHTFRLNRMLAETGSWILGILFAAMAKVTTSESTSEETETFAKLTPEEKADGTVIAMWVNASTNISKDTYRQIQKACLQNCQLFISPAPSPVPLVHTTSGKWALPGMEYDLAVVNQLIMEVLKFNLSPAFLESTSQQEAVAAQLTK